MVLIASRALHELHNFLCNWGLATALPRKMLTCLALLSSVHVLLGHCGLPTTSPWKPFLYNWLRILQSCRWYPRGQWGEDWLSKLHLWSKDFDLMPSSYHSRMASHKHHLSACILNKMGLGSLCPEPCQLMIWCFLLNSELHSDGHASSQYPPSLHVS